jgi:hypothetical protein
MEDTLKLEITASNKAELERLIHQLDEVTRRYDEQSARNWEEIEQLNRETREMLAQLRKAA